MRTNETIGDVIDDGSKLYAFCANCQKNEFLDLQFLVSRLKGGRDFHWLYGNLAKRLRCSNCNKKTVVVHFHPKNADDEKKSIAGL